MNGLFPFIINSLLGGMNGYQGNNMTWGNNWNNNIMDILGGTLGNQGNGMMGSMNNSQGNNNIIDIIGGILGNQGNTDMMGGVFNNQGNNNIVNMLGGMLGSQAGQWNNNINGGFTGTREKNSSNGMHNKRNRKRNNNINNEQNNIIASSFNNLFNQTFTAVVNNPEIIGSIVDNVLNSDLVNTMFEDVEKLDIMNIELKEYNDEYIIEGKLPGINKRDIDLDYDEEVLTVKVKNNQLFTNGTNRMIAIMQPNSDVEKKFIVNDVDKNRVIAVFKGDILRVHLPKKKKEFEEDAIIDVDNYTLD